jgi:hypothetical protein
VAESLHVSELVEDEEEEGVWYPFWLTEKRDGEKKIRFFLELKKKEW